MTGCPPAPRAILFDWDNTLIDNWPAIHEALNAAFDAMGHGRWTLEETRSRVRKSLRDSFPEMFGDGWRKARKVFYRRYAEVHLEKLAPLPGAAEALAWLAGEGLWLAVVSNKAGPYLRAEAAALGWEPYFGRLVGATDAERDKPARAPVALALTGSGLGPGPAVWFVGDGAIDVECALNAGLTPVVVERADTREELLRHNIDQFVAENLRVADMRGLKDLVISARHAISRG